MGTLARAELGCGIDAGSRHSGSRLAKVDGVEFNSSFQARRPYWGGTMGILLAFHQTYQPVGNVLLSALVAGLPLYVLFIMLAVLRLPAWICAVAAMLTAFVLSWLVWGMPFGVTVATATEGMAFGLWPISWIVLNAVFFHNLTVASGDFDVIKRALTRLTEDRRLQALLIEIGRASCRERV